MNLNPAAGSEESDDVNQNPICINVEHASFEMTLLWLIPQKPLSVPQKLSWKNMDNISQHLTLSFIYHLINTV